MRAPKYLYVLAAGFLISVAYLFSVNGFLYALCVGADGRRCRVFVLAKLFDGLSKGFQQHPLAAASSGLT
jgi:hypothetical protein